MSVADAPAPTFSPRTVLILLAVGVAGFVGLAALTAYAPELRDGGDGGAHALSRSAVGYAGLAKLLEANGIPVVIARGPVALPRDGTGLVILTPDARTSADDVGTRRAGRPVLVIAPKWLTLPAPLHPGWVQKAGLAAPLVPVGSGQGDKGLMTLERADATRPVVVDPRLGPFAGFGRAYALGPIESLQTVPKQAGVFLSDQAGRPLVLSLGARTDDVLLTDPDLLNNQGLKSLERARLAVDAINAFRRGGPVVFDVTLNGFERSRSLLRLAFGPPFLAATLCALAAALLMGGHALVRFGAARRPERAFALGKRALADNAAELIRMAKREPRMGARYADLTRRAIARAVAAGRDADPERLDAALDRLTGEAEAPLSALLADAGKAADTNALMQAAQRLHQRRLEMTRERS